MRSPDGTWCYLLKRFPQLTQTFVAAELGELERQGGRTAVVALSGPSGPTAYFATRRIVAGLQAPVRYLPGPVAAAITADSAAAHAKITRDVVALGATHLHAHFTGWAAHAAQRVGAATGLGYSVTVHATDIYRDRVDQSDLVELLAGARFVVTVTEDNRRHLENLLDAHARTARIVSLHNGVDLTRLHVDSSHREPGLVLGVGRLVEKNGHDVLIESVRLLRRAGRDVRCVIVGEGPLRAQLERQVAYAGLGGVVQLIGSRDHQTVLDLLRRASVFALPSMTAGDGDRDALPTVILEAMALGTPVVSTTVSGIPEMVEDGKSGLLVASRDPAVFAAAMGRLVDDDVLRRRLAHGARARVEERFDLSRNVGVLHDLFRESAGPQHGCAPRARRGIPVQAKGARAKAALAVAKPSGLHLMPSV
jgi:colanic acid/amylovoran biosynthesis glycosyltransferase